MKKYLTSSFSTIACCLMAVIFWIKPVPVLIRNLFFFFFDLEKDNINAPGSKLCNNWKIFFFLHLLEKTRFCCCCFFFTSTLSSNQTQPLPDNRGDMLVL